MEWSNLDPDLLKHALRPFISFNGSSKHARLVCKAWRDAILLPALFFSNQVPMRTALLADLFPLKDAPVLAPSRLLRSSKVARCSFGLGEPVPSQLLTEIADSTTITSLDLSGQVIDDAVANLVASSRSIKTLILAKGLLKLTNEALFIKSLAANQIIQTLNLSEVHLTQFDESSEVSWPFAFLGASSLTSLNLFKASIAPKSFGGFNRFLVTLLTSAPKLRTLVLGGIALPSWQEAFAAALARNTVLTSLDMAACFRTPADIEFLFSALSTNTSLQRLVFAQNSLSAAQAKLLVASLKVNSTLRVLNIRGCVPLQSEDTTASQLDPLSELLGSDSNLTSLCLDWISFSPTVLPRLLGALERDQHLKTLSLNMAQFSPASIGILSNSLRVNTVLTSLNLCRTFVGRFPQPMATLLGAMAESGSLREINLRSCDVGLAELRVLGHCLSTNTAIKSLSLPANVINSDGAKALAPVFLQNRAITSLDLSSNILESDGAAVLCSFLVQNRHLRRLLLSSNNFKVDDLEKLSKAAIASDLTFLDLTSNGAISPTRLLVFKEIAAQRPSLFLNVKQQVSTVAGLSAELYKIN